MGKIDINQINTKPTDGNQFKAVRVNGAGGSLEYVLLDKNSFDDEVISLLGRIPKWKAGTYKVNDIVLHNKSGSWKIYLVKEFTLTTTEEPSDTAVDWEAITSSSTGGNVDYTKTTPVTRLIGGLTAGYIPSGTIQDVLDDILYPFEPPTFTSSSLTGTNVKTIFELDEVLPASTVISFNYTISDLTKMKNSTSSGSLAASTPALFAATTPFNIKTASSPTTITVGATQLKYNVRTKIDFTLTGTYVNNKGVDGSMTTKKSIEWNPKRYRGYIPESSLSALLAVTSHAQLINVSGINIVESDNTYSKWSGTHTYNLSAYAGNTPPGGYVFYLYDQDLGTASFMSGQFAYATNRVNIATYATIISTATRPYYLYYSVNASSGSSIAVTPS
jgi:hypothetical protein